MNGDLIHSESAHLARRIKAEGGDPIEQAFERILNRKPTAREREQFAKYDGTLESICRVLLNSNEFLYVE